MSATGQHGRVGAPHLRIVRRTDGPTPVLITGGAGFVGSNLAHRLLSEGQPVLVLDNLSRPGVEQNLRWLRRTHGSLLDVSVADVRDASAVARAVARARCVYHFAAQVAVTHSLEDPSLDFTVNAAGTLNVLEAARSMSEPPLIVFTSTNKVYGTIDDLPLRRLDTRYEPEDDSVRSRGIAEDRPLSFHSPYGCSKGAADQYVLDYARTFGLDTIVLRMSCIYGPRQFGTEDQGWLAHFILCALRGEPITIFGDGFQVRDALYVDDLVDALLLAAQHRSALRGRAFNIGGGPANAVSVMEVVEAIARLGGYRIEVRHDAWRPGDQRYYVSDTSRFRAATGWTSRVRVQDGIRRLHAWFVSRREERARELSPAQGLA